MSRRILTYRQAVAMSDRQYDAAVYLFSGGFYNQAIARAYYSIHSLLDFIVRRRPDWPWSCFSDGEERPSIAHEDTPGYVRDALQATPGHTLDPRIGRIQTQEL